MKKVEIKEEPKSFLDLCHANHIKSYNELQKSKSKAKRNYTINCILVGATAVLILLGVIILNNKLMSDSIEKCSQNNDRNYCMVKLGA